jgi:MFS family permease
MSATGGKRTTLFFKARWPEILTSLTANDMVSRTCYTLEKGVLAMATLVRRRAFNPAVALVLLLGASVILNYIDRGALGVAAPVMKSDLRLSATAFGLAVSGFFWIYAPIQLVLGWLCDRLSVYRLFVFGTVLWSVCTLSMGFVGGFLSLFILRLMLGVGESIAFPGSSKLICRHVPPERRGLANAVVAAALALGPAIGTLLGGSIVAAFGWRTMFVVFGIASAIWLVTWQRVVSALPTDRNVTEASFAVRKVIGRRSLWSMGVAHFCCNFGFYFLLAWLPLYLVQQRGLTIIGMTMLATVGYAVQAGAAIALGSVSDRWTQSGRSEAAIRRWMMIVGQLVFGACIVGIFMAHNLFAIALLLSIAGICIAAGSLNLYAVAQMFAGPRASGTWVGIQNSIGNVAGIIGPVVCGILIDRAGYAGAFMLTATVTAFGGLWWAFGIPDIEQIELG